MIRRFSFVWLSILLLVLPACDKSKEDVISDLQEQSKQVESYMSHGKMVIRAGEQPITYDVEVWYKKPHFYRVALHNKSKKITQILLRNQEGVYVLTPHLKKSFRFQSNWPENNGQVYLYQTLLKSIVQDKAPRFQAQKDQYQFDVATWGTQKQFLPRQRIWLDHDYHPQKVQVLNEKKEAIISVTFDRFESQPSFDKDAFDRERNLRQIAAGQTGKAAVAETEWPAYLPAGSRLLGEHKVKSRQGPVMVMRYTGKKPFSLRAERATETFTATTESGEPVFLQQTVGVLWQKGRQKRLTWLDGGNQYTLTGDLPREELIKMAESSLGQQSK